MALVADATCAAAAGSEEEGGAGLGLPPRQAVAEDPEGSFSSATTKGGGRDRASAITFAFPVLCLTSEVISQKSKLPLDSSSPWVRNSIQGLCERLVVGKDVEMPPIQQVSDVADAQKSCQ